MGWTGYSVSEWMSTTDKVKEALSKEFRGCEVLAQSVSFTRAWVAYKNPGDENTYVAFCLVRPSKAEVLIKTLTPWYKDSQGKIYLEGLGGCPRKIAALADCEEADEWRALMEAHRKERNSLRRRMRAGEVFETASGEKLWYSPLHKEYVIGNDRGLFKASDVMTYSIVNK